MLSGIKESFENVAESIIEGIKNVLIEIFVPSEDFLSEKIEYLKNKFGIVDSIISTIDIFSQFFENVGTGTPPKIEMNFSSAKSKTKYGNTVTIDFSWYAQFKPTVDTMLSSIIWVMFVWRTFKRLPNIISGAGGDTNS